MNFALLLPAGLAALAALAIPLLIHLARRSEQRPTVFAALKWLTARPRPRTRLRFDEWWLLALRLLLLALIALLLARPVLSGAEDASPVVAVVPGARLDRAGVPADARIVWLAPGFPAYARGRPPTPSAAASASPTSLLRELDARLPRDVRVTVQVPPELASVDAERPRLSRGVDWRVVAGASPPAAVAPATQPPRLAIRHAPMRAASVVYLRAANAAWSTAGADPAEDVAGVEAPIAASTRHLAWLAEGPVPAAVVEWVEGGGVLLLDARAAWPERLSMTARWSDAAGVVVEGATVGRGRVLRLTRDLVPQRIPALLDGGFPGRLRAVLEPTPPAPARVRAQAHAPLAGAAAFVPAPRELQPWLILAIALLFGLERWAATGPRGRTAP